MIAVKSLLMKWSNIFEILFRCSRSLKEGNSTKKWHICKERILLLGNGPSLKQTVLTSFYDDKGIDIGVVNDFPIYFDDFFELQPRFLFLIDPFYFMDSIDNALKTGLVDILNRVQWDLTIVTLNGQKLNINNEHISYDWISKESIRRNDESDLRYRLYKKNLINCGYQNVMVAAIYYFLTNKAKEIYIAGLDMSEFKFIFIDENNEIWKDECHFYKNEKESMTALEKKMGINRHFGSRMTDYARVFLQFEALSQYAAFLNKKILNLSPYSYVDVFRKTKEYYNP